MHDGSIPTLQAVIREHYALAGRSTAVTGQPSPMRSELLVGFEVSDKEVDDLVAFLASLTDETFLKNPRHGNPWAQARR
jgi:cytochrome c peroxidase